MKRKFKPPVIKRPASRAARKSKPVQSLVQFDPNRKTQSTSAIRKALSRDQQQLSLQQRARSSMDSEGVSSTLVQLQPRAERATKRLQTYGNLFKPHNAQTGGLSVCETIKVAPKTRNEYVELLSELESWRVKEMIPPPLTPACVILTFLDFVDAQFFSGLSHADSSKTWAAIQKLIPLVLKEPDLCRRARNAIDGFNKRAPAESREPAPEEIYFAIIGNMLWKGQVLEALNETIRYLSMTRPGEIDQLLVKQFVPPVGSHRQWSLLLNIQEEKRPGKTGEYDEGVVLDQPLAIKLSPHFAALVKNRDPSDRLWNLEAQRFQQAFNQSVSDLKLSDLHITRYGSRHSAASHDLYHKLRSFNETKERGRWKSDHSMRRYSKAARLQYFTNKVPADVLKFGQIVKTELPKMFQGQRISPPIL